MLIPQDTYEIIMYDHNAVPYMYLQRWDRLEYHQRVNAPWNSVITFRLGYNDPYINDLMEVEEDHVIFIYRIDPITKNKERVYEGVHSTTTIQSGKMGQVIINFYSQGFTALLARRIVVPPDGQESVSVRSNADINMATLLIYAASGIDDPARALAPLSSAMLFPIGHVFGDIVEYDARYVNLLSAFETLAEAGGVRFGVTCPTFLSAPTYLQVEARRLWGLDRRINSTQTENKMFFNYESGNMEIPIYSKNYSEEKNVAYVGGQGVGANRRILQLIGTTSTRHHWARKEAFTDARGGDNDEKLLTEGLAYLSKNMAKNTLTFNVRQVPGSLWPLNWGLGDVLTAKYRDTLFEKEIREVVVTVTGGSTAQQVEIVAAEMEDVGGSLGDYLAIYTGEYYDPTPLDPPVPYEYPSWDLRSDIDRLAMFSGDGYVYRTDNFNTPPWLGGPTWDAVDLGLSGYAIDAGTGNTVTTNFVVDPYSPLYINGSGAVNGWITTGQYIYRVEDIFGTPVATVQATLPKGTEFNPWVNIDASFAEQGFVLAVVHYNHNLASGGDTSGGTHVLYTTDGETWTTEQINGYRELDTNYHHMPGLLLTSKAPGQAYTFAFTADATQTFATPRCFVTNDYGASWSVFETDFELGMGLGAGLHIPWHNNAGGDIMYYSRKLPQAPAGDQNFTLYRRNADGTHEAANPDVGGVPVGTRTGRWGVGTSPLNRLKVALAGCRGPSSACYGLYTSLDGGDTWTERIAGCTGLTRHVAVAGDEDAAIFTFGSNKQISVAPSFEGVFESRDGNIAALAGSGEIVGICGG